MVILGQMETPARKRTLGRIRWAVAVFMAGLVISGGTALALETEMQWLLRVAGIGGEANVGLAGWLVRVHRALEATNEDYPFMAYGYDWLAFGHFMIAIAFVGAWREPVRNRWLFDFGLIACGLIIPYALVFGEVRGIPVVWRLIDCSFGVFGAIPLLLAREWTRAIS